MTDNARMDEIRDILAELQALLQSEEVLQLFPGLTHAYRLAEQRPVEAENRAEIASIVRTMYGGMGTFQDLVIWRDEFADRKLVNERLERLRNRLYDLAMENGN